MGYFSKKHKRLKPREIEELYRSDPGFTPTRIRVDSGGDMAVAIDATHHKARFFCQSRSEAMIEEMSLTDIVSVRVVASRRDETVELRFVVDDLEDTSREIDFMGDGCDWMFDLYKDEAVEWAQFVRLAKRRAAAHVR